MLFNMKKIILLSAAIFATILAYSQPVSGVNGWRNYRGKPIFDSTYFNKTIWGDSLRLDDQTFGKDDIGGGGGGSGIQYKQGVNIRIDSTATDTVIHSFDLLTELDTIYILSSGQSNMGFPNEDAVSVGDTLVNTNIQIWDWTDNTWKVARVGVSPFDNDGTTSGNMAWYFAKRLQEATKKQIKWVLQYEGGQAITSWHNGTAPQRLYDSIVLYAGNSGVNKFDVFIWSQGESDNSSDFQYVVRWDSLKANLRYNSWFPPETPIISTGLPQIEFGAQGGFQGAEKYKQDVDGNNDPYDIYAITDSATTNTEGGNKIHYNSDGLIRMGGHIYDAYKRLPVISPRTYIRGDYLWLRHNDSAQTNNYAMVIQNQDSDGHTGFLIEDASGTDQIAFGVQNTGFTLPPYSANTNYINSAREFGFYTNFVERMRIQTGGVIDFFNRFNINPSSASVAYFTIKNAGLIGSAASVGGNADDIMIYNYTASRGISLNIATTTIARIEDGGLGVNTTTIDSTLTVDGGGSFSGGVNIDQLLGLGTYSGSLTDGAPTDAELQTAIGVSAATAGDGAMCKVEDTDGTGGHYIVVSNGTAWGEIQLGFN